MQGGAWPAKPQHASEEHRKREGGDAGGSWGGERITAGLMRADAGSAGARRNCRRAREAAQGRTPTHHAW